MGVATVAIMLILQLNAKDQGEILFCQKPQVAICSFSVQWSEPLWIKTYSVRILQTLLYLSVSQPAPPLGHGDNAALDHLHRNCGYFLNTRRRWPYMLLGDRLITNLELLFQPLDWALCTHDPRWLFYVWSLPPSLYAPEYKSNVDQIFTQRL